MMATVPRDCMLTQAELRVLGSVASGLPNKDVASEIGVSIRTVKNHLRMVYAKLGVQDRLQAVLVALDMGLVSR